MAFFETATLCTTVLFSTSGTGKVAMLYTTVVFLHEGLEGGSGMMGNRASGDLKEKRAWDSR